MSISCASGAAAVSGSSATAADGAKRLFNLLENESKERVLRVLTNFRTLTPLEQAAAAQELGVALPQESANYAAARRTLHGPALAVRQRDPGYVPLAAAAALLTKTATGTTAGTQTTTTTTTKSARGGDGEAALTDLVRHSLEGKKETVQALTERPSSVSPTRRAEKHDRLHIGRFDDEDENEDKNNNKSANKEHHTTSPKQLQHVGAEQTLLDMALQKEKEQLQLQQEHKKEDAEAEDNSNAPTLFRSRGYQALRLARGEEIPDLNVPYTRPKVINVTGMPVEKEDMREWFDQLDLKGGGELGVVPFLQTIAGLERNFGVGPRAEAEFRQEVEMLAENGALTFEQFSYLVTRFARH